MKNKDNLKYILVKILAVLTVFQTTVGLNTNNKEKDSNKESYNHETISLLNNLVTSNYQIQNIRSIGKDEILIKFDNSDALIKVNGGAVYVHTSYVDGYTEKSFFHLSNLSKDDLTSIGTHAVSDSYNSDDSSLLYDENGTINNYGKEKLVMEAFKVNQEELDFVLAGAMAEGIQDNYEDVSAAMRTGLNRLFSYSWVNHAINSLELDVQLNEVTIYDIFRDPLQFGVYYSIGGKEPRYLSFLGVKEGEGYQAALDTLFYFVFDDQIPAELRDKIIIHDYLEFQDKNDPIPSIYTSEQFVLQGNKHYRHIKETDIIPLEESVLSDYKTSNKDKNIMTLSK